VNRKRGMACQKKRHGFSTGEQKSGMGCQKKRHGFSTGEQKSGMGCQKKRHGFFNRRSANRKKLFNRRTEKTFLTGEQKKAAWVF